YAALACFCVAAGAALAAAADRLAWRRPWATLGPDVAGVILAICAVGASRAYARAFESPEALWSLAVARNPGAWSAHNDLGYVRYAQGRLPEAIAEFEAAARANPRYPEALNNLGAALADAGRLAEAEARCRQALALRPGSAGA